MPEENLLPLPQLTGIAYQQNAPLSRQEHQYLTALRKQLTHPPDYARFFVLATSLTLLFALLLVILLQMPLTARSLAGKIAWAEIPAVLGVGLGGSLRFSIFYEAVKTGWPVAAAIYDREKLAHLDGGPPISPPQQPALPLSPRARRMLATTRTFLEMNHVPKSHLVRDDLLCLFILPALGLLGGAVLSFRMQDDPRPFLAGMSFTAVMVSATLASHRVYIRLFPMFARILDRDALNRLLQEDAQWKPR